VGTPAAVTGAELITALFTAAQKLDENDIPSDGRFAVLRPSEYYKLITGGSGAVAINTSAANKDVGGSGSLASGSIAQVAGITIYKSNHIPSTDLSAVSTGDGASSNDIFGAGGVGYNGDFRNSLVSLDTLLLLEQLSYLILLLSLNIRLSVKVHCSLLSMLWDTESSVLSVLSNLFPNLGFSLRCWGGLDSFHSPSLIFLFIKLWH
jgi:hypothetical protein